jgi:hypothetical protein
LFRGIPLIFTKFNGVIANIVAELRLQVMSLYIDSNKSGIERTDFRLCSEMIDGIPFHHQFVYLIEGRTESRLYAIADEGDSFLPCECERTAKT